MNGEKTKITCLCCEGQGVEEEHRCPIGMMRGRTLKSLCGKGSAKHRGFCSQCREANMESFEQQFQERLKSEPQKLLESGKSPDTGDVKPPRYIPIPNRLRIEDRP